MIRLPLQGAVPLAVLAAASLLTACGGSGPLAEPVGFPGGAGSAQARLTHDLDGTPLLSWLEPVDGDYALKFARFDSGRFGEVREVVRSDLMFVNWADFPSVTPITPDVWFAHWLRRQGAGSYAYDVATRISTDGGASWSDAEQMNGDETEAEHGFVSVFPRDDRIDAFWLDGRELAEFSFDDPDALLGTSLRLAEYDLTGQVAQRSVTDELVCDCCQPDVALTDVGPVVIYRDRTPDEIRDVVIRRQVDGLWSEPVGLGNEGWFIDGCPVNGPVIAARGSEVVAAWFTAARGQPRLRFARSEDSAITFGPVIDLDNQRALGQPAIVLDENGRALVSWWQRGQAGGIDLVVRTVGVDGIPGEQHLIAHESVGQPVDVPQLIAAGANYLLAWTTFDDEGSVRVSVLDL